MQLTEADPKGLVRESYNIEGITEAECKSIFIDWALSLKTPDTSAALAALLAQYGQGRADHPMTAVLTSAQASPPEVRRRGGRMGRLAG